MKHFIRNDRGAVNYGCLRIRPANVAKLPEFLRKLMQQ
jgi:hypothetical protein